MPLDTRDALFSVNCVREKKEKKKYLSNSKESHLENMKDEPYNWRTNEFKR